MCDDKKSNCELNGTRDSVEKRFPCCATLTFVLGRAHCLKAESIRAEKSKLLFSLQSSVMIFDFS